MSDQRKRKPNRLIRHGPSAEAYLSITSKRGNRTEVKMSGPSENFRIDRSPNTWTTIYRDNKVRLITCIASASSDYVVEGQRVFQLIFWNGQRIRIDKGDLSRKRIDKVNFAINKKLNEVNN